MTGLLLAGLMASPAAAFAEAIPLRGIVEGFYGTPWTTTDRMDILGFCGEHGLNAYIYAPKDDPYHRDKWREPYPKKKLKELASLVEKARENRVKFIFAVSPGLDFHYTILRGQHDKKVLLEKLESVYAIGVRDFAIFFDDIDLKESDGKGQAELLNWLDEHFVKRHDGVSPLITVPTEYYRENMVDKGGRVKPYTEEFSQNIRKDVLVLYTGDGVVCPGISEEQLAQADNVYGRHLGIWWNYPVTDYMEQKLALGPVERLPRSSEIPAIFFNPMKYEELSKIALATGADYANDPDHYEPQASWERAIKAQYGKLSEEAADPVIIMNRETEAAFKGVQYSGSFATDIFEGLPRVYSSALKAFSAATSGDTYAIVGDLGRGAQANFPNGNEITIKFDDLSLAEKDLVKIVGREFVALGVVGPGCFVNITK